MPHGPPIDPERLAALLDGRLSAAEAEAVRSQLANSDDELLATLADAAFISRELNPEKQESHAVRRAETRWYQKPSVVSAALAAGIAIIAVGVFNQSRGTDEYSPAMYATALSTDGTVFPAQAWSSVRGGADELSDRIRAARVGALLERIEIRARQGQGAAAQIRELATTIESVPGAAPVERSLQTLANAPTMDQADLGRMGRDVIALVDARIASTAAYLETARFAVANSDTAFFASGIPATVEAALRETPPDALPQAVEALRSAAARSPVDMATIGRAATSLLAAMAR